MWGMPAIASALVVIAARYSHFARATVVQGGPDVDTVSCAQQLARASSAPPAQDPCGVGAMSAPDIHALASSASLSQIRLALASGVEVTTPGPVRALPRMRIIIQNDVSGHQRAVCLS
jgi:hypothetical protein